MSLSLIVASTAGRAFAYRTSSDLPELEGATNVAWDRDVGVTLSGEVPPEIPESEFREVVRRSFSAWGAPSCSSFRYGIEDSSSAPAARGDGLNSIAWVTTDWAALGVGSDAAATTDVQYATEDGAWKIVEADIYLNAENFSWSLVPEEGKRAVQPVLTHEVGHLLGLLHPCDAGGDPGAPACDGSFDEVLMHPVYDPARATLSDDDVAGVCALYPVPGCEETGCASGQECTSVGCVDVCGEKLCGSDERCVDGRCVDRDECAGAACACEASGDCDGGFVCESGLCVLEGGFPGDPCEEGSDCRSGSCSGANFCASGCSTDAECGREGSCSPETGLCAADERRGFGEACDSADDCVGGRCLADLTEEPVCSRSCAEDVACPLDWECDEVEEESVCVPARPPLEGCTCRESPSSPASAAGLWMALGVVLVAGARRSVRGKA